MNTSARTQLSDAMPQHKATRQKIQANSFNSIGQFHINDDCLRNALVMGTRRQDRGYLTIGIPTIHRQKTYLIQTLSSIIKETSNAEQQETTVVIFIADLDTGVRNATAREINSHFSQHLRSGFFQVITAPSSIYPDFSQIKSTFNDSNLRVAWRTKQNLDYIFMFAYSKNISDYYIQLEDDVTCGPKFLDIIKTVVTRTVKGNPDWFCIEFSKLGFIGKLFHSSDLPLLLQFILMFNDKQPGDNLLHYIREILTQFKRIVRTPAIFKHKGVVSSLANKEQLLKEISFKELETRPCGALKQYSNNNPQADIVTNIKAYKGYTPEKAYSSNPGCFWGMEPRIDDYFRIYFLHPIDLHAVYIKTGDREAKDDILHSATMSYSTNCSSSDMECSDWHQLATFSEGQLVFDVNAKRMSTVKAVKALSIDMTKNHERWVIIHEISIMLA